MPEPWEKTGKIQIEDFGPNRPVRISVTDQYDIIIEQFWLPRSDLGPIILTIAARKEAQWK